MSNSHVAYANSVLTKTFKEWDSSKHLIPYIKKVLSERPINSDDLSLAIEADVRFRAFIGIPFADQCEFIAYMEEMGEMIERIRIMFNEADSNEDLGRIMATFADSSASILEKYNELIARLTHE